MTRSLYGIWTPNATKERTVVARCRCCGLEFFEGEMKRFEAHVAPCAKAHLDEIREELAPIPLLRPENHPDPEIRDYMEQTVRPRMEREGRLELKPNERAGFS